MASVYRSVLMFVIWVLGLCLVENTSGFFPESFPASGNMVISPFLLAEGLAQLYLGAQENTAKELALMIPTLNSNRGGTMQSYLNMNRDDLKSTDGFTLKLANQLFVREDIPILKFYKNTIRNMFNAEVRSVDFSDPETLEEIKKWVANSTDNKITEIIDRLEDDDAMLLLSVIYFKAQWRFPFDKSLTEKAPFYVPKTGEETQIVEVDMMNRIDLFTNTFVKELDATAIELPYANSNISMIIFLPRAIDGINKLVKGLADNNIHEILRNTGKSRLQFSLPKFKFEYIIELEDVLKSVGVVEIFEDANLRSMTNYDADFALSEIIQKGVIEIDEDGSTADVAQSITPNTKFKMEQIEVNHPFAFVVKDSSRIFFAGKVQNPLAN